MDSGIVILLSKETFTGYIRKKLAKKEEDGGTIILWDDREVICFPRENRLRKMFLEFYRRRYT